MSPARRAEIAELAEAVSVTHTTTGAVNPRRVAAQRGISTSFGDYGDAFDGMLEYKNGRFHIFANLARLREADSPRTRFTMGHELGHYFIDEHRNALASGKVSPHLSRCEFESLLLAEQEADHFAANFLMPASRFREAAAGKRSGFDGVLELAGEFGTSLTSTAIRCATMDISPCVVIKWHWHGYKWKYFSRSMFRRHFKEVVEVPEKLPAECATRRALAHEAPPDCGFFQNGTLASSWFPWVRHEDFLDVVLVEEAVPLGRYGALAMLYPRRGCPILGRRGPP